MLSRFQIIGVVACLTTVSSANWAMAATADEDTCDRIAALPFDRDRPESAKGATSIAKKDIPVAIKACATAAKTQGAHRRFTFQLGRTHEFARAYKDAAREYTKAAAAGSSSAMIGLGMLHANGQGVPKDLTA